MLAPKGIACEFGVFNGNSLRIIRNFRKPPVFGFDSFEGLPEQWDFGSDKHEKGHFTTNKPKDLPIGTYLVDGFFDKSLPEWVRAQTESIKLIHIDSDLYSSAKTVLSILDSKIEKDCIIIFDELVNLDGRYTNWQDGEWKALNEWLEEFEREVEPIGRTESQQVAFIVKE